MPLAAPGQRSRLDPAGPAPAGPDLHPLSFTRALDHLVSALETAAGGSGVGVLVDGGAGTGRSTLLRAVADRAGTARVLRLAGVPDEQQVEFGLAHRLLRSFDAVAAAPVVGALLDRPESVQIARVAVALLRALELEASRRPLLLLVDDGHLADRASLQLLAFVVRHLGRARVMIVVAGLEPATIRTTFADIPVVRVTGLDAASAGLLLEQATGRRVDPALTDLLGESVGWNAAALREVGERGRVSRLLPLPDALTAGPEVAVDDGHQPLVRAALLERAAAATTDAATRAQRWVLAADAAVLADLPRRAIDLLDLADDHLDPTMTDHAVSTRTAARAALGEHGAEERLPSLQLALASGEPDADARRLLASLARTFEVRGHLHGVAPKALAEQVLHRLPERSTDPAAELARGLGLMISGRLDQAVAVCEPVLARLTQQPTTDDEVLACFAGAAAAARALWDAEAMDEILRRAEQAARRRTDSWALRGILGRRLQWSAMIGDPEEHERIGRELDQRRDSGRTPWVPRSAYEQLFAVLAAPDHEACYRLLLTRQPDHRRLGTEHLNLPYLVESALRTGREGEGRRLAEQVAALTFLSTPWAVGQRELTAALVADEPEPHFHAAVDALQRSVVRLGLGRAHLLHGEWLRREARKREARDELLQARQLFLEIGRTDFAERAARELRAAGLTIESSAAGASILTAQESSVAELAADGATNVEIAQRLFISRKTVDYHLGKVYRKLGVASRRRLRSALSASSG